MGMIICVDFDGTIVQQNREYDDVSSPLEFMPDAKEGLEALKEAGHTLILWSGRSNPALWKNWMENPLWRDGVVPFHPESWEKWRGLNRARRDQMLAFVKQHLPHTFDYILEYGGKPVCDLFIDDKTAPPDWWKIACRWGDRRKTGF